MKRHISVEEFAANVDDYLDQLSESDNELVLLKDGIPSVVVISATAYEEYEKQLAELKHELGVD